MKVYRNLRLAPKSLEIQVRKKRLKENINQNPQAWLALQSPWQAALEAQQEKRDFGAKSVGLFGFAVMAIFVLFLWQLLQLQFVQGGRLFDIAEGNRIRSRVIYAQRGNIYDRNGETLASNSASFQLIVTPYSLSKVEAERNELYQAIARITHNSAENVRVKVEQHGLEHVLPVLVDDRVEHEQMLQLKQYLKPDSAFRLDEVPIRRYDNGGALAHIVGYTGRIDNYDLEKNPSLYPIDFIGRSGVEAYYDSYLRGENGFEQVEVDALGRPVRTLARKDAIPGNDLYLTIDSKVQKELVKQMQVEMKNAESKKASATAINPNTGEILALVSLPAYDNNLFSHGISEKDYAALIKNKLEPLYNSAISGAYPSGSTIKPVVAAAALEEKVVDENTIIIDTDSISVGSFSFHSWRPGGLGPKNVRGAIAWSSNIYFMTVGGGYGKVNGIGVDKLTDYYRQFGFGALSGIDLPGEVAGTVPDRAWKQEHRGEGWYIGDTYNISIGQGDFRTSTLQLASAHSVIANGGTLYRPYVGKKVVSRSGETIYEVGSTKVRNVSISKKNLSIAREGMRETITNGATCSCTFENVGVNVAGKSGTAETDPNSKRKSHAWYSAFAPFESPEIVISTLLEEGQKGSGYAAPPISKAMEFYFKNKPTTAITH